jgi:hypothetical protein
MGVTFINFVDPRIPTTDTGALLIFEETSDIKRETLRILQVSCSWLAVLIAILK